MPRFQLYVRRSHEQTFRRFLDICKREKVSASLVIARLIRTWVDDHTPGNIQQTLADKDIVEPYEYDLFPVERRRQLMEDLSETIERNPKVPILKIAAAFAVESGLREETVVSYIRTLKRAGRLRRTR